MLRIKEYYAIIADGTGFGYDDTVTLSYLRGKELRKVKSHVKVEVLVGKWGKYVVLLGVKVDKAYNDELKMLSQILASIGNRISAKHF